MSETSKRVQCAECKRSLRKAERDSYVRGFPGEHMRCHPCTRLTEQRDAALADLEKCRKQRSDYLRALEDEQDQRTCLVCGKALEGGGDV